MNQFLKRKAKEASKQQPTKEKTVKAQVEELLEIVDTQEAVAIEVEEPVTLMEAVEEQAPETEEEKAARRPRAKRRKAYGVYLDRESNKYMMVTIDYTVKTGYSSIVSVEPMADNWRVAMGTIHNTMSLKLARGEETE